MKGVDPSDSFRFDSPLIKGDKGGCTFSQFVTTPQPPFLRGNFRYLMRRLKSDAVIINSVFSRSK
jgi:hypothetical protein